LDYGIYKCLGRQNWKKTTPRFDSLPSFKYLFEKPRTVRKKYDFQTGKNKLRKKAWNMEIING